VASARQPAFQPFGSVIAGTIGIVGIVHRRRRGIAAIPPVVGNKIEGVIPGERCAVRMKVLLAVRPMKGLFLRDGKASASKE
jgi:hypothetical protein